MLAVVMQELAGGLLPSDSPDILEGVLVSPELLLQLLIWQFKQPTAVQCIACQHISAGLAEQQHCYALGTFPRAQGTTLRL